MSDETMTAQLENGLPEMQTWICALRGGLSGIEGGYYFKGIKARRLAHAATLFANAVGQEPTDVGLPGGNLAYIYELEQRTTQLEAELAAAQQEAASLRERGG